MLLLLNSCRAKHDIVKQDIVNKVEISDTIAINDRSEKAAKSDVDTLSFSAALSAGSSQHGQQVEVDTSRTVIVTDFGADGLPVRQTETRTNGITRTYSWDAMQWQQVCMLMEQLHTMQEQYDVQLRQLQEQYSVSRADSIGTREQHEIEPKASGYVAAFRYGFVVAFVLIIVFFIWKGVKSS